MRFAAFRRRNPVLPGRNEVVAKLDNRNDNQCRHGWSEQEIHNPPSPQKWEYNRNMVLLNYHWNERDDPIRFPAMC
jgi:hypothetical protein